MKYFCHFNEILSGKQSYFISYIPQTNEYQKIDHLHILPNSFELTENNLVVFEDKANSFISIKYRFGPRIIKKRISSHFVKSDYQNLLNKLTVPYLKNDAYITNQDDRLTLFIKPFLKEENISTVIRLTYEKVLSYLSYGNPIEGLYTYEQAFQDRITDCGGYSTFLSSLLRMQGIPTRLVIGYILSASKITKTLAVIKQFPLQQKNFLMHAWVEAFLPDGSWFPMDPSIEWKRREGFSAREGGFGYIPDDRLVYSFGEDFLLKIKGRLIHKDILQHPFYI